jgi:methionyl-tRNA formyltransferase
MSSRRVVFLSRGKWGPSLLRWLGKQSCDVVYSDTDNRPVEKFPDYDLGIAFLYGHRIPASEFDGRKQWINFHSAPLPELRGRDVAYQAIMQEVPDFGASIHYMDAGLDTGPLIEVQRFPIKPHFTAGDLALRSQRLLLRLFRKHIPTLLQRDVPSVPQVGGAYYPKKELPIYIELDRAQQRLLRALTAHPLFHAKVTAGGRSYRIIPE